LKRPRQSPPQKKSQRQRAPAAPKPASGKKLSYKEKYALEKLPAEITALHSEITILKEAINDPALFERDAALFNTSVKALEAAEARLSGAEDEWLALEIKREELNG